MWLRVSVPEFGAGARITIARFHAVEGNRLAPGSALVDLEVDLSGGVVRDCPPVSTCRLVLREAAWLRKSSDRGELVAGDCVAMLSLDPHADPQPARREARVTAVAVLHHIDWWNDAT